MEKENDREKREMEEGSFSMIGGDGPNSYAKNSNRQKEATNHAKTRLVESIIQNLEIGHASHSSKTFRIADLGCSTGPNTFNAVKTIVEAVTQKYKIFGHSSWTPEFQVYFCDHVSNDFNMLFTSLPPDREYFASGVPGSFHQKLFPKASINFAHSSCALHWMSKVPKELGDLNSPVCNKGRIFYFNAPDEVGQAYAAQYAKDIDSFLAARAEEMVPGGLIAISVSGRLDGTPPAKDSIGLFFQLVESCLLDMANEGKLSKEKIDSFNLPMFNPSPDELRLLIQNNGCFSLLTLEISPPLTTRLLSGKEWRAGLEGIIRQHFGSEIIDELFERYEKKAEGQPLFPPDVSGHGFLQFILLQRKH